MSNADSTFLSTLMALSSAALWSEILFSYIGAGADLGLIAYMMTFLTWLVLCFGAVVLWPIRALFRRLRGGKGERPKDAGDAIGS